MALTRKDLQAMGVEPEKIESIIAAHVETVNALKDECDDLRAKADQLMEVQKQLDDLKTSGGDWQKKYEDEHKAFEQFKTDTAAAELTRKKSDVFRDVMKKANIPDKVLDALLKIADVDLVKLDESGTATNREDVENAVKEKFADYIMTQSTSLDKPETPPAAPTGKDAFNAMSLAEQMRYANEHPNEVKGYLNS